MSEKKNKTYWKGIEEKEKTPEFIKNLESEFPAKPEEIGTLLETTQSAEVSRRSFLKAAGFTMAGTLFASCVRGQVEKSIPVLVQPEEITPGRAYWYATTCAGCNAGCGILTKNRDGRPIKIEGNPAHPLSKGGVCAVGQAMVLGLYDSQRLQAPLANGQPTTWEEVDSAIDKKMTDIRDNVYFLTGTMTSPSTRAAIQKFLSKFKNSAHIEYDPVSYSAILDAHEQNFGRRVLPHYKFDQADVILSFDADFLGTWISPVEFAKAYTSGRKLDGKTANISKHIHLEGRMSITGSNADRRIRVTPAENGAILIGVAKKLAQKNGSSFPDWQQDSVLKEKHQKIIDEIVNELWQARGKSLVVCGLNDTGSQQAVNFINNALGNYGKTLDSQRPSQQWRGNDRQVQALVDRMKAGQVNALFVADVNPAYSLPDAKEFSSALKQVPLTASFSDHLDETSSLAHYILPVPHFLEAWNDAEIASGVISVSQPTVTGLGHTRSLRQTLNVWLGTAADDLENFKSFWQKSIFPRQKNAASFQDFWDNSVHDGYAEVRPQRVASHPFKMGNSAPSKIEGNITADSYSLVLYQKAGMLDGRHAHNAWLHELSDPITKVTWDNYASVSPATADKLGLENGDIVNVTAGEVTLEVPAHIQPGQHDQVIAIALGYGRMGTERFANIGPNWLESKPTTAQGQTVGKNSYIFTTSANASYLFSNVVKIAATGKHTDLALTQTYHTITVPEKLGGHRRDLIRETTLAAYQKDPASGNHVEHHALQLWEDDYIYEGHHWAMAIDLSSCTGCSACVVSCQAENNVAVVGKDEVFRRREMAWLRLDRYYSGEDDNIDVLYQPVMCQHCDHAPCEGVCPVLATVHSDEGLNQQIYNRCVGTRYCANNCPYKVRRFNWFDYRREASKENLALNPDITTRSRGVMEKCSLCVQRIQEAKAEAKRLGKPVADGDIKLACEQSCPADAIVFGDMNDPDSRISKLINDPRHYRILEEMNFRPSVGYMTKVRNRDEEHSGDKKHG